MTDDEKEKLIQQRDNLMLLFELHTEDQQIEDDLEYEQHLNDILDMIAEIEERLKE